MTKAFLISVLFHLGILWVMTLNPVSEFSTRPSGGAIELIRFEGVREKGTSKVKIIKSSEGEAGEGDGDGAPSLSPSENAPLSFSDLMSLGNEPPSYPKIALDHGWEGEVLLKVIFSPQGKMETTAIERSSGYSVLDESALSASLRWKLPMGDRERVEIIPVQFTMVGPPAE